jgi:copper chaperone NosL
MKTVILILLISLLHFGCQVNPVPLRFGSDLCNACKMTLMDNKFGAELVTHKGKVYLFDDLNCMLNFYHSEYEEKENIAFIQVIDFAQPGHLIDAQHALYIKSEAIRSPMASNLAAFSSEDDCKPYHREWKGILLSWGEVTTQFK